MLIEIWVVSSGVICTVTVFAVVYGRVMLANPVDTKLIRLSAPAFTAVKPDDPDI
jgi:hypothetical protein